MQYAASKVELSTEKRKQLTLSSQVLEGLKITGMHSNYICCHKHSILQSIPGNARVLGFCIYLYVLVFYKNRSCIYLYVTLHVRVDTSTFYFSK